MNAEAAPGEPCRWHKLAAALLIVLICGLELRAVLGPYEDWPFTSAPMFARYHAPGDPLFELAVWLEPETGPLVELEPDAHLGLGELGFRRQFFAKYYGSTDPRHPSGHHPHDDEASFRARLSRWMQLVSRAYTRRTGMKLKSVQLEVRRLSKAGVERRPVAHFEATSGAVRLLPWRGAAP